MKKQFLVLAGSALLLASCGGNKTETTGPTQAQMDSAVNAKVAQHDAEVAAKNDSTLKAIEAEKAAAEAKANEHAHSGGTKKHTEKASPAPAPPPPPPPPPTIGNGKPSMNSQPANNGTKKEVGNGKPSMK